MGRQMRPMLPGPEQKVETIGAHNPVKPRPPGGPESGAASVVGQC